MPSTLGSTLGLIQDSEATDEVVVVIITSMVVLVAMEDTEATDLATAPVVTKATGAVADPFLLAATTVTVDVPTGFVTASSKTLALCRLSAPAPSSAGPPWPCPASGRGWVSRPPRPVPAAHAWLGWGGFPRPG